MHLLVYMLAIPVFTPAMLAAYAVAGERAQGSLEPVLTTPIRREEFLVGKALAVLVPSIAVAYVVFAAFLAWTLFADPAVAVGDPPAAGHRGAVPVHAAACLPLHMGRDRDLDAFERRPRRPTTDAPWQHPGRLVHLAHRVRRDPAEPRLAIRLAVALFLADIAGWRVVAPMFDRERLVTGSR